MVRAVEQEQESYRTKLFNFKGMFEMTGKHTKSMSVDGASTLESSEEASSKGGSKSSNDEHGVPRSKVSKEEIAAKEARDKLLQG